MRYVTHLERAAALEKLLRMEIAALRKEIDDLRVLLAKEGQSSAQTAPQSHIAPVIRDDGSNT